MSRRDPNKGIDLDSVDWDNLADADTEELERELDRLGTNLSQFMNQVEELYDRTERADRERDEIAGHVANVYEVLKELERERTERRDFFKKLAKGGLAGLIGATGLAGLYGLSQSGGKSEWSPPYEIQMEKEIDPLADEMAVSNYDSLKSLSNHLREASDDFRQVALGLEPSHGDVGVRQNSYEDYTLQERYDLGDAYERARKISKDVTQR